MLATQDRTEVKAGIAARLRAERERLRLTQTQLAQKLGLTRFTIANYESGSRMPTADQLHAFAAMGADVSYVVTGAPSFAATASQERFFRTWQGLRDYCRLSKMVVPEETIMKVAFHIFEGSHPSPGLVENEMLAELGACAIQKMLDAK